MPNVWQVYRYPAAALGRTAAAARATKQQELDVPAAAPIAQSTSMYDPSMVSSETSLSDLVGLSPQPQSVR